MFNKLVLVAVLFCTHIANAGKDSGNGGDGVLINGRPYLFDLYERGLHLSPNYNPNIVPDSDVSLTVAQALPFLNQNAAKIVAIKIQEIRQADRLFAQVLLITLSKYFWSRVNDVRLLEIDDEDGTGIDFPIDQLVQLAARKGISITLDQNYLSKMDASNQAATVMHEIVYAITPPKLLGYDPKGKNLYSSASPSARMLNAFLFSRSFGAADSNSLQSIIEGINSELGYGDYGGIPILLKNPGTYTGIDFIAKRIKIELKMSRMGHHYIDPSNDSQIASVREKVCGDVGKHDYFEELWLINFYVPVLKAYDDYNHDLTRTYMQFEQRARQSEKKSFRASNYSRNERQAKCYEAFDSMVPIWKKSELEKGDLE